jgi:hypothetical protein
MGKYPAPPAVAIQIAGPARRSVTLTLGIVAAFVQRNFLFQVKRYRHPVSAFEPIIKIDPLATLTAKRTERIAFPLHGLLANGTAHN